MNFLRNCRSSACVFTLVVCSTSVLSGPVIADEGMHLPPGTTIEYGGNAHGHKSHRPDSHAPIGVMGDHMHKKGEWMLSYRYMRMEMDGNRIGDDRVSPETIATTVPNRFFGRMGQPPTLRVVPTRMTMDMHMFGAMYAPTNNLTLMAMLNYVDKEMEHVTFRGGMGTTRLGTFTTEAKGIGDTKIGGLYRLYDDHIHHFHLNMGLSLPTGSITKRDRVLAPNGMRPDLRLPYPMQLGSGTVDLLPGLTYTGKKGSFSWGAQYMADIRLEDENDEGYALGDKHSLTSWIAYRVSPWASASFRVNAMTQDSIDGIDLNVVAPVQTADPNNHGGERVDLLWGVNLLAPEGALKGHRLAVEFGLPVYQNLNGPQLETDWTLAVGWQKAF
ncbi:MAG: hypothetical protein ACRBCJ_12530 [Hyphomicrobiaceae bacterium]